MSDDTSTWGGHAVRDHTTKKWHGFFAEMTNHCTLSAWTTNSIIVQAIANDVTGPYDFYRIVQPAWSHNPLVTVDESSGEILVAHIGCGTIAPGHSPQNCSGPNEQVIVTARADASLPPCECSDGVGACQTLQVLSASNLTGAFGDKTVAWPLTNTSAWPSSLSNPSILLPRSSDGPLLVSFNGNLAPPNNHGPTSHPGLLVSRSGKWDGPFEFANRTQADAESVHYLTNRGYAEDAVLYHDKRGHVHMLQHGFYDKFPGVHGWSTDPDGAAGDSWEFSATPAYGFEVNLNSARTTLNKRERPQVVLQDGVVTHLFNGARGSAYKSGKHTFNMVTEVCQNGPAVLSREIGAPVCP